MYILLVEDASYFVALGQRGYCAEANVVSNHLQLLGAAHRLVAIERVLKRANLVDDAADRPNVNLKVVLVVLVARLDLGRCIGGRAHHRTRSIQRVLLLSGETKVAQLQHYYVFLVVRVAQKNVANIFKIKLNANTV